MEVHFNKFQKISNGNGKLAHGCKMDDGEEEDGENRRGGGGGLGRFHGWPSSRIVRVSSASGGKDRHSKVLTSKGLRDRRVRLSVNTAIQFYDLQDRLGYDQPSKAVEWLLKAAATSIDELPPMISPFLDSWKQVSDDKRSGSDKFGFESVEVDMDAGDPSFTQQQQQVTKSSACSSTSETSKGSAGLSLSRSESRIKARESAKGRVGDKEKEKVNESSHLIPISQTTSFTELLNGGINNTNDSSFSLLKSSPRHWSSTPMDYFTPVLLSARSGLPAGNPFTFAANQQPAELQQFSFLSNHHSHQDHNDNNNLRFSISSSSANFNRGTLQSNSSSPQFQRFNSDGSPQGFYTENQHPLQLSYGDRHTKEKPKTKVS